MAGTAVRGPAPDWTAARSATLHCLLGCTIGEVTGMAIGQGAGWSPVATIALSVALAFVAGIALATVRIARLGLPWRRAVRVAAAAEVVSISVMELVDNLVLAVLPGGLTAGPTTALFWGAMAVALAVAFVVTLPVNALLIARGRGHALVPHAGGHHT
ncbi:DUF4396 domain-containing protein [Cellulomonas marina]|uniref:DUF4396 domain-containing protein n=1 Tax=Cellulomonas marina TaxID=988821 RepID=A0A1I0Z4N0_9CELL|nr:DUF4396 domain-containing protein [Cellulomonas marina]GIG28183.1 hypothetical protein Cma02nite_07830 [Cellulomonas marina]SFB19560.1 protein of unknown function [Cellulomonas marina]